MKQRPEVRKTTHKFRKGAIQDEEKVIEGRQRTWRPAPRRLYRRLYRRTDRHGDLPRGGCTEGCTEGRTDSETCQEEAIQEAAQKEGQTQKPARRLWQQPNQGLKVPWARTVTTKQGN